MKTINYIAMLLTLCVMAIPVLASASGSKHKVTFEDNGNAPVGSVVSVVFVAAGCAGKRQCGNYKGAVPFVCRKVLNVTPGETVAYSYKDGTSLRRSIICSNANSSSMFKNRSFESGKKHIHVCAQEDGTWGTYNDPACTKNVGSTYATSDDMKTKDPK